MEFIPFLRTLDANFFARLAFFVGLSYVLISQSSALKNNKVTLEQPDSSSATRFSKTLGKDEHLDKILKAMDAKKAEEGKSEDNKLDSHTKLL